MCSGSLQSTPNPSTGYGDNCEKLPSDSVMLVYLSTSGKVGRHVAPTEYMGGSKQLSRIKVHELRTNDDDDDEDDVESTLRASPFETR
uniref:Uncharacterized protein n=1 Tax=Cannabis sativa TaxID=3483 RepID=A0A803PI79_CANSA